MAADDSILIVPVDLVAFCVGTIDAQGGATSAFAGAQVDFTDQTTDQTQAFIGANVARDLSQAALVPLEQGVHLHWALPDALTHINADEQGNLTIPAAPNRWLVSRILIQGATPTITSWVVESDTLSDQPATGQAPITLPVTPQSATDQNYRYVGKHGPVGAYVAPAKGAGAVPDAPFATLTGKPLSAVSNGTPSFASFYPNCRSVFGFWDTMDGVPTTAQLMYLVTGWHEDAQHDPVAKATPKVLRDTHRWSMAVDAEPAATLYSGLVQSVAWNAGQVYVSSTSLAPITADVAVGATPAEVMSAYFGAKAGGGLPGFEQLLNALQFGLLRDFAQPQGDQLAKLEDALHEKEFAAIDAGLIYTIAAADSKDDQDDAIDLPIALADALNDLNAARQAYDRSVVTVEAYRWQLFADWYRIFEASSDFANAAFQQAMARYGQWQALSQAAQAVQASYDTQYAAVNKMLDGTGLALKPVPAPRYWQPAEPALLIRSPDLAYPSRYGGDGAHSDDGTLVCRTASQVVTAVTVNGTAVEASAFASLGATLGQALPHVDVMSALVCEACLLDTALVGAIAKQDAGGLQTALAAALAGDPQDVYQISGVLPSPVAVTWWSGNPWLPMFLSWNVQVLPVQATVQGTALSDYPASFFTANFTIDPATPSFVRYQPAGIPIDPVHGTYSDAFSGASLLSPVPAQHFSKQLQDYVETYPDPHLTAIIGMLGGGTTLVQPLSGFARALTMRQQEVQLPVATTADSIYAQFTGIVQPIIGNANTVGPMFNGSYEPIRAGYMVVSTLQAVDVFGQKRNVTFSGVTCATSMAATIGQTTVPSVAYLAPRIAQPARLVWNWISADSAGLDEMNAHPATSPICGWLMPQHLDLGFFLYDQQGKPLGTLQLNGDQSRIQWQSAPGDDPTINQPIEQVLADAHPQMLALGTALMNGGARFFKAFWKAVDQVHGSINPALLSENSGLSVLVGRPVALVQALLRLELQGPPAINQGWSCLSENAFTETDNGLTQVKFPVELGDVDQMDDGLIGYFVQTGDGSAFDFKRFFTQGADGPGASGVVQPTQTTLTLTASPKLGAGMPPDLDAATSKVLMLVDPRASVHATTGILPTQELQIPPDQSSGALSALEMWFLAAPILKGAGGLAIPTPSEAGFALSWVEQTRTGGAPAWAVEPRIGTPSQGAVWAYTPQQLSEGWLRFNPNILEFSLLDAQGHPSVQAGTANTMSLVIANLKPGPITFKAGTLVSEGTVAEGSIFYIHLGALVAPSDVAKLGFALAGWTFQPMTDSRYGAYWAAAASADTTIPPGQSVTIEVTGLTPATGVIQGQIYFDYYGLDGAADGVSVELVSIRKKT